MDSSLSSLLKRDRFILGGGLLLIVALAWGYMIHEAHNMSLTGVCCCAGMKMSGPDVNRWSAAALLPLSLMWAEMMVAMMLPTVAPMVLTFASVNRKRREREQPYVSAAIFVLGYLTIWTGFSFVAAAAQWALHGAALLSPAMVSSSRVLAAVLLLFAGLFQFSPLKHACLRHCRSPLTFLITDWHEGKGGAFLMGLKHGAYCTGCCCILMALLFVLGVMNIWWVGAVTAVVLLEKLAAKALPIAKIAGFLLLAWAAALIVL